MNILIIEEDVRAECLQNFVLGNTPEEECLVNPNVPFAERSDHPFMRGTVARRNQSSSDYVLAGGLSKRLEYRKSPEDFGKRSGERLCFHQG